MGTFGCVLSKTIEAWRGLKNSCCIACLAMLNMSRDSEIFLILG